MRSGRIIFLLHAHMPYVRHPEHGHFIEERWFYEAVVESYIPLLDMFERLINDGVRFGATLSLSPTLLEMLADGLLNERLAEYMERLVELTESEIIRNRKDPAFGPLALMYNKRALWVKGLYELRYAGDLVGALRRLARSGHLEIITTSATHAYLPNFAPYSRTVRRQIRVGIATQERHLGSAPRGLWLPECGYYEGLDEILSGEGVEFCFLESHGVLHASPRPRHGVFRPVRCPSGLAAFGRDSAASGLVWCAASGYPGDHFYRDFYRDVGYELPPRDVTRFVHPDGIRVPTGLKYYRITGKGCQKKPYIKGHAFRRAGEHALDFVGKMNALTGQLNERYGFGPLVTVAFDAELFGHWWFEGPEWLERTLRGLGEKTVTPSEYLCEDRKLQTVAPGLSSWGSGGYGRTWLEKSNDWALWHLHKACERMEGFSRSADGNAQTKRALRQAERELLLSQSSDWPFLMQKGASAGYAQKRLTGHLEAFSMLYDMALKGPIDENSLRRLESRHPLFPEIGCG
jgi:1,4-alpha-glucan branching enzyme